MGALAAYFDESGTHGDSPFMCVAGYLFPAAKATEFSKKWSNALRRAGVPYFHMSECAPGIGVFEGMPVEQRDNLARELRDLIRRCAIYGVAVCVARDEFKAATPDWWIKKSGDEYTACLQGVMAVLSAWSKRENSDRLIAYFFESGHKHQSEANRELDKISKIPALKKELRYASHLFVEKGLEISRPCEAADFLAWHLNKILGPLEVREHFFKTGRFPHQSKLRKDLYALIEGMEDRYWLEPVTGERLEEFFAGKKPPFSI